MGSLPSGLGICTTAPDIFYLPELVSRPHQRGDPEGVKALVVHEDQIHSVQVRTSAKRLREENDHDHGTFSQSGRGSFTFHSWWNSEIRLRQKVSDCSLRKGVTQQWSPKPVIYRLLIKGRVRCQRGETCLQSECPGCRSKGFFTCICSGCHSEMMSVSLFTLTAYNRSSWLASPKGVCGMFNQHQHDGREGGQRAPTSSLTSLEEENFSSGSNSCSRFFTVYTLQFGISVGLVPFGSFLISTVAHVSGVWRSGVDPGGVHPREPAQPSGVGDVCLCLLLRHDLPLDGDLHGWMPQEQLRLGRRRKTRVRMSGAKSCR